MARSRGSAKSASRARARPAAPAPSLPPDALARLDALVREVRARPDDDDVRLVLADALLAHGDPRGELIALQLAATGDDERLSHTERAARVNRADRIDRLLRDHARDWLGSLTEITYRACFARGFLAR